MCDDIVKCPQSGGDLADIHREKGYVGETQGRHRCSRILDLARRQIDTCKGALRQAGGHQQEVAAGRTARLEHSAALNRRSLHAEQASAGGQTVRMGLCIAHRRVRNVIVTGGRRMMGHRRALPYGDLILQIIEGICATGHLARPQD